jgi:hypothetical protein
VDVQALETGTALSVYTQNTHYRITVLNGASRSVVVQGGFHFPEPTHAHLQGASGPGSVMKIGWIGAGLRMEIADDGRHVVTSPVRSITLEEVPAAQRDFWRIA